MNHAKLPLLNSIESRFQLLIAVSLFFPVLLANLLALADRTAREASLILIQVSVIVGLYLLDYILFQIRKNELKEKSLNWVNRILLIALGIFIVPIVAIVTLTLKTPSWLTWVAGWLSGVSVLFVLTAPPVVEFGIIFSGSKKNRPGRAEL